MGFVLNVRQFNEVADGVIYTVRYGAITSDLGLIQGGDDTPEVKEFYIHFLGVYLAHKGYVWIFFSWIIYPFLFLAVTNISRDWVCLG